MLCDCAEELLPLADGCSAVLWSLVCDALLWFDLELSELLFVLGLTVVGTVGSVLFVPDGSTPVVVWSLVVVVTSATAVVE